MVWIAEPYIAEQYPVVCVTNFIEEDTKLPIDCYKPNEGGDDYSASIINVTNMSGNLADMTVIFTIYNITLLRSIPKSLKRSMVICKTNFITSAYLTLAGLECIRLCTLLFIRRPSKEEFFNHLPREGDILHSCTGARRYV